MELKNKICIVTGGSRGIGKTICSRLAEESANVLINYNKSKEEAENLKELIKNLYGVECLIYKADVSKYSQVTQMINFCLSNFGKIDVVVNNAGIKGLTRDVLLIGHKEYEKIINEP